MKTKSNLYLFMEYCPEGNLQELLEKTGKLKEEEALAYFGQIIKGLQVLSAAGVVHRDLKPANILIKGKTLKIADFGLAKKYFNGQMLNSYKGTPLHMAPEILLGRHYTDKVDVYSAGTILYQMLFGTYPFLACTEEEIVKQIKNGLRMKSHTHISKGVKKLLTKMLEADPEARITLGGVIDFLSEYVEQKREERLDSYRVLAKSVVSGVGIMGAMLGTFNWKSAPASPTTTSNMDLKLYGRLYCRLSTSA
jgi:serine/threonine protein kinase